MKGITKIIKRELSIIKILLIKIYILAFKKLLKSRQAKCIVYYQ